MEQALVKIISARDGEMTAQAIRDHLSDQDRVRIEGHHTPLTRNTDIVIFIVTPQSLPDTRIQNILKECAMHRLRILPVVENLNGYDFTRVPRELDMIRKRNALGWKSSNPKIPDGEEVLKNIRGWIGQRLFERERQLFVSYRRSDGQELASEIYDYFTAREYRVFLDTEKIPGGFDVQRYIEQAIFDRDVLLLLDSPDAKQSEWIQKEINIAIHNRIKIVALRLPGGGISLPREVRVIDINETIPLDDVETILKEEISRKMYFDSKVEDTLDYLKEEYCFKLMSLGTRRVLLKDVTTPDSPGNVLLEYENSPHSLESLYRLNCGYEDNKRMDIPISSAFFIYAGMSLSEYQKSAVRWARNDSPLDMVTLDEFVSELLK